MGLLVKGSPLDWSDSLEWLEFVRSHGIDQFLKLYHSVKDIEGDVLKWGDELEYGIFKMDSEHRIPRLSLRGAELLEELNAKQQEMDEIQAKQYALDEGFQRETGCNWVPEYGAWMIEGTPSVPYGGFTSDLRKVEGNMRLRRARLLAVLHPDEIAPSVTAFPTMGVRDFTYPPTNPNGPVAQSNYVSDDVINPHPRFATLTRNIRQRRTEKVDIRVPIFKDVHTETISDEEKDDWTAEKSRPTYESKPTGKTFSNRTLSSSSSSSSGLESENGETLMPMDASPKSSPSKKSPHTATQTEPTPGFIHMDCMAFGMGMCCLQVTFQAKNVGESRHLYDHLGVLSPILLALTAATPILKGRLADTDVRWATISAAVDDRTPQERGLAPPPGDDNPELQKKYARMAGNGSKRLPKSRYEGISAYICNHKHGKDPHSHTEQYNDVEVPVDEKSYKTLIDNGLDQLLAQHVAHLFIRDPLVIYKQRLHLNNSLETDHFENIQSTNWQTVRWKPPPPRPDAGDSASSPSASGIKSPKKNSATHVGWRTEFRSMEIQLTDFENAAFTVFIALLSRVILTFDLNMYIPLSKVNENMETAHRVNSVLTEKFYFRCHMAPPEEGDCRFEHPSRGQSPRTCAVHSDGDRYEPMTIAEIMHGKGSYFTGLIPIVYAYLDYIECDEATRSVVSRYLSLISKRATGELPTAATWMRRFVMSHPDYAHDSVVSEGIAYDLLQECQAIGEGTKHCAELLGDFKIAPVRGDAAYQVPLKSEGGLASSMREKLLRRYLGRTNSIFKD